MSIPDKNDRQRVEEIFEVAKRDTWHLELVGSDVRELCRIALRLMDRAAPSATQPSSAALKTAELVLNHNVSWAEELSDCGPNLEALQEMAREIVRLSDGGTAK